MPSKLAVAEAQMDASNKQFASVGPSETGEGEFWGQFVDKTTEEFVEENDSGPQALAASAMAEIDRLMDDLASAREYLMAEAERVKRETTRLNNLSKTAMASAHIISDNFRKWQQSAKQPESEVASPIHGEGAHVAPAQNGKEADGAKVTETQGKRGKISTA
jgi:hypothetical protein